MWLGLGRKEWIGKELPLSGNGVCFVKLANPAPPLLHIDILLDWDQTPHLTARFRLRSYMKVKRILIFSFFAITSIIVGGAIFQAIQPIWQSSSEGTLVLVTAAPTPRIPEQPPIQIIPAAPQFADDIDGNPLNVRLDNLRNWIVLARQNGRSFASVIDELKAAGWQMADGAAENDFDQDGAPEWLFIVDDSWTEPDLLNGGEICECQVVFWGIGENGVEYQDHFSYELEPTIRAKTSYALVDFTDVGGPVAFVARWSDCTRGCVSWYQVLGGSNGEFHSLIEYPEGKGLFGGEVYRYYQTLDELASGLGDLTTSNEPFDDIQLGDTDGDGSQELIIVHGGTRSAGAGDQRGRTETWGWTGTGVGLKSVEWEPTEFDLHMLREANDLFDMGRYTEANELYLALIEEDTDDANAGNMSSIDMYSGFRIALSGYLIGNAESVETWSNWVINYDPNQPVSASAQILLEHWRVGASAEAACDAVVAQLNPIWSEAPRLKGNPILPEEFGGINTTFDPISLCPLGS